ncbi:cystinosin homolog [Coccinella septempunctata]|uniref:cystinosin homolog n=1 Tax=Coccinella septempunctata TaxID=41139 RepID=UPI001D065DBB|nr:cystinosin homolog [Coccinella septempunctata]XP_044754922.1 cystinosin homolog [Coccinella septempunctata]XP_044754923.1 cystinosin homolog [Coccinella septempunctata]
MRAARYGLVLVICCLSIGGILCDVKISTHDLELKRGDEQSVFLEISDFEGDIQFIVQHEDIVNISPKTILVENKTEKVTLVVKAVGAGHSEIYANETNIKGLEDVYLRITVNKVPTLDTVSSVIGWIYFVAWSISFYPQIYTNFKRKSVVGLNFDFLALNLIGFTLYSIFNIGLYWFDEIKTEYANRHPRGLIPVLLNDIFFAVHAIIATLITIIQCYIYERDEQRISLTAKTIMSLFGVVILISFILSLSQGIHWLDFLYICSYVKLTITLIKYIPQAYMNYRRQSTQGWSIGNIFLDFTGGMLSMLQMLINAFNYDDWVSIFGDPTKFGLGFFSVLFDVFFIIQHYILYRLTNYSENP